MKIVLLIFQWSLFVYLFVQVFYLLFFSIAGRLAKKTNLPVAKTLRRIRIFIPAYKEDSVIIDTVRSAVAHDYPKSLFEVIVIADSFSASTLQALKRFSAKIIEVSFDKSTKGKALQKAIEATKKDEVDIVLVLDADNHMASGFLHKVNNAFEYGYKVVQGHRTAKHMQTSFARLDACTEEINNHIFRRGHNAVGLPSALIGSGMAFSWKLFISLLKDIGETSGEDKEVEFRIVRQRINVLFLDNAYIFDEKVAKQDVFSKQRSRWLATQFEFFSKYFIEGWMQLFKGNVSFFNKVFQTYLLPRVMLIALAGFVWLLAALFFTSWFLTASLLLSSLALSLLLALPSKWYNRHLLSALLQIPGAFISMIKALLQVGKARKQFIHTPHGEQLANQ